MGLRIFAINPPARCFFGLRSGIWLLGEADKTELEAGRVSAGRASREETIGGASGARTDARDVRGGEASAFELVAHDSAQVDKGFAGTPGPRMIPRAGNLTPEATPKLGVNLETTIADRRSHRGANVGGASAELDHRADAGAGDIRNNATPSAVERAGYFSFRIDHQNRHAVGRIYSQDDAGFRSDDPVAGRAELRDVASRGVNDVAMHLVQARHQLQLRHLATDALPVSIDGIVVVADPIRKIHRGERAGADAADAPDESVADRGVGKGAKNFDDARFGR